jgi:hypothetical protein
MNFLLYQVQVGSGQSIVVELDHAANVQVMDDRNLSRYRRRERFQFYGGLARRSPSVITPPSPGKWNVAIDLGGASGRVNASVSVQWSLRRAAVTSPSAFSQIAVCGDDHQR